MCAECREHKMKCPPIVFFFVDKGRSIVYIWKWLMSLNVFRPSSVGLHYEDFPNGKELSRIKWKIQDVIVFVVWSLGPFIFMWSLHPFYSSHFLIILEIYTILKLSLSSHPLLFSLPHSHPLIFFFTPNSLSTWTLTFFFLLYSFFFSSFKLLVFLHMLLFWCKLFFFMYGYITENSFLYIWIRYSTKNYFL